MANGKQRLKKIVLVVLALYIMIGSLLYTFQEKLIFLPTTLAQDYAYEFQYPFEELFLNTDTDAIINAIHFKANNPKGIILYFHGNAGDLSRWGTITEYFVDKQYDVLVMDYRTYGKSTGKLSEQAFYNDAQFCYNYLLEQYPEDMITVYGRSLGTGIASYVASKNNPKQLILETPYYSIVDVAKNRFPLFPVKKLLKYKFLTYQYIQAINCPITIFHGTEDHIVPYKSSQKLLELGIENLKYVTVSNAAHNNLIQFSEYNNTMKALLNL